MTEISRDNNSIVVPAGMLKNTCKGAVLPEIVWMDKLLKS